MNDRDNSAEVAAAQHVVAVVGGEYALHDTGTEPGQYDVDIKTADGVTVALEATSFGGDDWKQTADRVRKQLAGGAFAGDGLRRQWLATFQSGSGVREMEAPLTEVLLRLEREGVNGATSRYDGDDATLQEVAGILGGIRVNSVFVFDNDPPDNEPRIFPAQSQSSIGGAGALPAALSALFEKRDNQEKLARSETDERHLYVFMEDGGASAVLEGMWPPPASPEDPAGVIDTFWVYCPSASSYLFRTRPADGESQRFIAGTGEPSNL